MRAMLSKSEGRPAEVRPNNERFVCIVFAAPSRGYPGVAPLIVFMSRPGLGASPNAAFAALSARLSEAGASGLSNELGDIEKFVASKDDANLTAALDRRCRALEGMGLVKVDKVSLNNVPAYKTGQDPRKWADALFGPILQIQGGAILQ